jgi:hypothetical protein
MIAFRTSILAIGLLSSCATQPIYLHQLKEAEELSVERLAYVRLEKAVDSANSFLQTSMFAKGFPAENAQFKLGVNHIIIILNNEYSQTIPIETATLSDPRLLVGDNFHNTGKALIAARKIDDIPAESLLDNYFLQLDEQEMAETLLFQACIMREIQARGSLDYWLNYILLGLNPSRGWGENSHVNERAHLIKIAYQRWREEQDLPSGS